MIFLKILEGREHLFIANADGTGEQQLSRDSVDIEDPGWSPDGKCGAHVRLEVLFRTERRQFDPVGHYARPDVFRLQVDVTPHAPVTFAPLVHDRRDNRVHAFLRGRRQRDGTRPCRVLPLSPVPAPLSRILPPSVCL